MHSFRGIKWSARNFHEFINQITGVPPTTSTGRLLPLAAVMLVTFSRSDAERRDVMIESIKEDFNTSES